MYVTMVLGNALIAVNLQKLSMKLTITATVINIILNALVIPKYSYIGASFTTVATEAYGLFIGLFFFRRYGYSLGLRSASGPPILGLSVIAAVSALLLSQNVPLLLITSVDLVLYAIIIYKLGLKDGDKRLILSLLKSSKASGGEL